MRRRRITALLLSLALTAGSTVPAATAGVTPRASLPDIEDEVMCPVCGTPLNISESPQADRQRAFIRVLIAEGQTKEQIKQALVGEFGSSVLALPDDEGFELAAYVVPIVALAAVLAGLGIAVAGWRRYPAVRDATNDEAQPTVSPADARRLEEDLARHDL